MWCTFKVVVLLIKPIAFLPFLLTSPSPCTAVALCCYRDVSPGGTSLLPAKRRKRRGTRRNGCIRRLFSLFIDPLFSLQSPSRAGDKVYWPPAQGGSGARSFRSPMFSKKTKRIIEKTSVYGLQATLFWECWVPENIRTLPPIPNGRQRKLDNVLTY